jgi:hypothetical protein
MISRRIKVTLLTGTAVLAIAGTGTGVVLAQSSDPPSPTAVALSSATPAPQHGMPHGHGRHGGLLARIEHGEATVTTNHGDQVVDFQRGIVASASSGRLTVRSADGFTATYVVNNSTKIRRDRKVGNINQVVANDRVIVVATKAGGTTTATRIHDTGPAK